MAENTLAKAMKIKNRLAGRLAKVQADIQAFNSVPQGQVSQPIRFRTVSLGMVVAILLVAVYLLVGLAIPRSDGDESDHADVVSARASAAAIDSAFCRFFFVNLGNDFSGFSGIGNTSPSSSTPPLTCWMARKPDVVTL